MRRECGGSKEGVRRKWRLRRELGESKEGVRRE